jgi:hypothetical protein
MPYLRLYSRGLQIEQKRVIAPKLIEIMLRTFRLGADQRYQTSIQFITQPGVGEADDRQPVIPDNADFALEVLGHNLTQEKTKAFSKEAAALLRHFVPMKPLNRIAHVLGIDSPRQIAFQFGELAPLPGDPWVVDTERWAA